MIPDLICKRIILEAGGRMCLKMGNYILRTRSGGETFCIAVDHTTCFF